LRFHPIPQGGVADAEDFAALSQAHFIISDLFCHFVKLFWDGNPRPAKLNASLFCFPNPFQLALVCIFPFDLSHVGEDLENQIRDKRSSYTAG
jgi:hypothetical protein